MRRLSIKADVIEYQVQQSKKRNMKLHNLDSVLTFGQYKGETVAEVLKKNTSYIISYCLKEHDDFYITDEVYELSIIYGYKGSIDGHIEDGGTTQDALNILIKNDSNKNLVEEKRNHYKDYMIKQLEKKLEEELSGNGNIIIKHSIF